MLWLNHWGSGTDNVQPKGDKVDTLTNNAGADWDLWYGSGAGSPGNQQTYSFVATKELDTFDGDIMPFMGFLTKRKENPCLPTSKTLSVRNLAPRLGRPRWR
jgi:hypothetical protein